MDIGFNNGTGLIAVINYLRNEPEFNKKALKLRGTTFKQFLKSAKTLQEATKMGFSCLDVLSEHITWDVLRSKFQMDELLHFGVDFDIASQIGLQPKYYGGDAGLPILRQMGATDEILKKNITNLQKLRETNWSPATAKKAGFSLHDLISMGNIASTLSNWNIKQIVYSYNPKGNDWVAAGYGTCLPHFDKNTYNQFVAPHLKNTEPLKGNRLEHNKKDIPEDYILKFDETKLDLLRL